MRWLRSKLAALAFRLAGDDKRADSSGSRMSIRTKFLMMMLMMSLLGQGITNYLASQEGKKALTDAAFNQLTSYRAAKKQQVEWYFRNLRDTLSVLGTDGAVIDAFRDFRAGYRVLGKTPLSGDRKDKLVNFYKQNIIPKLLDDDGKEPPLDDIFPREPAALELQSLYITENPNPFGEKDKLVEHPVINPYTVAHAKHHTWLHNLMIKLNHYDVMLVT